MKLLKLAAASALALVALAACGGGAAGPATLPARTTITGVATKGPFAKGSTVSVYAVANGAKGALVVQTATTDDNGSYSADLGSYAGPVVVEVSGSYLDEATGGTVTIPATAPLRAALPEAQGAVSLPVTPLTELAMRNAGGSLTPEIITAANALVSELFKVDIVNTLPVTPTETAVANATPGQKDYTLALAAISQLASESAGTSAIDKLQAALAALSQGISSTGMTAGAAASFQTALSDFVTTNSNNHTGIGDTSATGLVNVGTLSKSYTLSLQGNIPPGTVKGIQFDLVLPAGVTVNVNSSDSTVLTSSLTLSAEVANALLGARYSSGAMTVGIGTAQGIGVGGFATLICNIPSGASAPPASAFSVNNARVVDVNGDLLAEGKVAIN